MPAQASIAEGNIYDSFLQVLGGVLQPENPGSKNFGEVPSLINSLGLDTNANQKALSILSTLSRSLQNLGSENPPLQSAGIQEVGKQVVTPLSSATAPNGQPAQAVELLLNSGFTRDQVGELYQSIAGVLNLETAPPVLQPVGLDKAIVSSANHLAPETPLPQFSPIRPGEALVSSLKSTPALPPVFSSKTAQPVSVAFKPILTGGPQASTSTALDNVSLKSSEDPVIKPFNGRAAQLPLGVTEKLPNSDRLFSTPALKNQPTLPQTPVQLLELVAQAEVDRTRKPVVEKLSFKEGPSNRFSTSTSVTPNTAGTSESLTTHSHIKPQIVMPSVSTATLLPLSNPETITIENETTPPGTIPVVDVSLSALKGGPTEPIAAQPLAREVSTNNIIRQIAHQFSVAGNIDKGEIQLKLDPPSLGTVRLRVATQGDSIRALIITDHNAVKQLIENNLPQLRDAISGQGLKVESFSVLVGGHSHQENPFGNPHEKTFNSFAQNGSEENVVPGSEHSVTSQPGYARQSSINIFA